MTMNNDNVIENIDFDDTETELDNDYQTSAEAVEEYGQPVVEAAGLEVGEETVSTGRSTGLNVDIDNESFEETYEEVKMEMENEYKAAGLDTNTAATDFGATVGVALAVEAAEQEYDTDQVLEQVNDELEFEYDFNRKNVEAGQDAYINALNDNEGVPPVTGEPEGTGSVIDSS